MILLYILGGLLGMVLLYLLVIAVCALLVDPEKEYKKDNRVGYGWLEAAACPCACKRD